MSEGKGNIDELLKESFRDFRPDAPDVWNAVNQGIQQAGVQAGAGTAAVKGAAVITKAVIAIASAAVIGTAAYFGFAKNEEVTEVKNKTSQEAPAIVKPAEALREMPAAVAGEEQKTEKPAVKMPAVKTEKKQLPERMNDEVQKPENKMSGSSAEPVPAKAGEVNDNASGNPVRATEPAHAVKPVPVAGKIEKPAEKRNPKPVTEGGTNVLAPREPVRPNVFTPDGDRSNDTYVIDIQDEILYSLVIIDRRTGKAVFESKTKSREWDGTDMSTGQPCEEGNYYYYIFTYQQKGGKETSKTGIIQIIR